MSNYCSNCGEAITGKFCQNCGKSNVEPEIKVVSDKVETDGISKNQINPNIFKSKPIAAKEKKKTGCLSYCILIVIFIVIWSGITNSNKDSVDKGNKDSTADASTVESSKKATPTPKPKPKPKNIFTTDMSKASGLTKNTVADLYDLIHNKLGFKDITFDGKNGVGDTIYDIKGDGYTLRATLDEDEIYSIICGDYNLYEKSKVKMDKQGILDRTIDNGSAYYSIAKEIVTSNLKSPKSADFPSIVWSSDEIQMQRNGSLVAVQGYVDAQNSFGAEIRSTYLVEFIVADIDTYTYTAVYVKIDEETSGEFMEFD